MCIVAFAWRAHPRWKLVVIGNRDELHGRPAAGLHRWEDSSRVLGGKDLTAGGTWLGISEEGRFAVVTNVANGSHADPKMASRGKLLKDYLTGDGHFADLSTIDPAAFNPFNLIAVDEEQARLLSNHPVPTDRPLDPGFYGLSNGPISNPWPKSHHLVARLQDQLDNDDQNLRSLLDELQDEQRFEQNGGTIENGNSSDADTYRSSPVFIRNSVYGTRCSTIVAIKEEGEGFVKERSYDPGGHVTKEIELTFRWPDADY